MGTDGATQGGHGSAAELDRVICDSCNKGILLRGFCANPFCKRKLYSSKILRLSVPIPRVKAVIDGNYGEIPDSVPIEYEEFERIGTTSGLWGWIPYECGQKP